MECTMQSGGSVQDTWNFMYPSGWDSRVHWNCRLYYVTFQHSALCKHKMLFTAWVSFSFPFMKPETWGMCVGVGFFSPPPPHMDRQSLFCIWNCKPGISFQRGQFNIQCVPPLHALSVSILYIPTSGIIPKIVFCVMNYRDVGISLSKSVSLLSSQVQTPNALLFVP
jgi:hypothetical protein